MGLRSVVSRHRVAVAFAAGVLLTLAAAAVVVGLVLAHQYRSARLFSATLSRVLGREVRIGRIPELGPGRIILRDVELPAAGGWPAEIRVESVEASGPLGAAAAGGRGPVRVVITRPTIAPATTGAATDGRAAVEAAREGLAAFLGAGPSLDVAVLGGGVRDLRLDLVMRKADGVATLEAVLRGAEGPGLVLGATAKMEGQTARVALTGSGSLAPLAPWLPASAAALARAPVELRADAGLEPGSLATVRGGLALGEALALSGEAVVQDGVARVTLPGVRADVGTLGRAAGLAPAPAGRLELGDVVVTWPLDRPGPPAPTLHATARADTLTLPAAGGGEVTVTGLGARLAVEPAGDGFVARGEVRTARARAAGLDLAPVEARYEAHLERDGALARVTAEPVRARVHGLDLRGAAAYDAATRRLEGRVEGERLDAAPLLRAMAPSALGDSDRVAAGRLRVTWSRVAVPGLDDGRIELTLDELHASLPALRGAVPRVVATAELGGPPGSAAPGGVRLAAATVAARDGAGQDLLTARLEPAGAGALRATAEAPDLARLDGLWPDVERKLSGRAALAATVSGPGWGDLDGRLTLQVPDAEVLGGKVLLRDLTAELPVRRGPGAGDGPAWGRLAIAELIGYGLVVRDMASPARLWKDRLSLNQLTYALYSASGKGWAEVELEAAGPWARGELTGTGMRIEEAMAAYGVRGGTMTGLLGYDLDAQYRAGHLGVKGRFDVPAGGSVSIELLDRLLAQADADPTGVVRSALENLRNFEYKSATASVRSVTIARGVDDLRFSLSLLGRERFGIFPPRVKEINVHEMPLSFLMRQFPSR